MFQRSPVLTKERLQAIEDSNGRRDEFTDAGFVDGAFFVVTRCGVTGLENAVSFSAADVNLLRMLLLNPRLSPGELAALGLTLP